MMNYTTVTFDLGICNITLLSAAVSQPQTHREIKQKIEREGFNSRIQLKKTMPEDETHYKALQGLCDNPPRATVSLFVGEKEETASPIFSPYDDSSFSSVPSTGLAKNSA